MNLFWQQVFTTPLKNSSATATAFCLSEDFASFRKQFKLVYVVSAFQTKSSICISCGNITLTLGFAEDIGKIGKVKNM